MDLLDDLHARGLIHDHTDRDSLRARLAEGPVTLYCGFDPTAPSLGWWNLLNLCTLRRFEEAGHRPIALAGGATGMVGDPSGRSQERNLLDETTLARNLAGVSADLARVLDVGDGGALILDNASWTRDVRLLDFLRDVGKHLTVNQMTAKESVRQRMESEDGISFTEFSYMLLQAHDYLWLHEHEGCELQIGGSDQWGNITAGIELVRKRTGAHVHGLTSPLLTNAEGQKLGKSTGGTVYLDPDRTSPYRFYQHWVQQPDAVVGDRLRQFTFLPVPEIDGLVAEHAAHPERREAQRRLAREVTDLVHGHAATEAAEAASAILFGADLDGVGPDAFTTLEAEVDTTAMPADRLHAGVELVDLLVDTGLAGSRSEARRQLEQGGVYVNNRRAEGVDAAVADDDLRHGRWLLLRKGKRTYHLVRAS